MGIKAIKAPRAILPQFKTELVEIPFRSEPYVIPDYSLKAEVIPVQCWVDLGDKTIYEKVREWFGWLVTPYFSELIFDDDPEIPYRAICITNIMPDELRSPIITIEFNAVMDGA